MVRYIVNDVAKSIAFYTKHLDFKVEMHPAPGFALLVKGDLKLFLNQPRSGGAGQKMADGTLPEPGGWNRIMICVDDVDSLYQKLSGKGIEFRNKVIEGQGGKQALLKDPSGNLIELFESKGNKS